MFDAGTHIRVYRVTLVPYWHHGVVIGETEVVEFGGGSLLRKGETCVRQVSLATFENGRPAEIVQHPITWRGLTYSDPLPPAVTIDRALWLVHHQPPRYQLGFRNCESIAVWCASGDYETFQAKKFMQWKAPAIIPIAYVVRKKPALGFVLGAGSVAISLMTGVPYMHNRAFFKHTKQYPGLGNWTASSQ